VEQAPDDRKAVFCYLNQRNKLALGIQVASVTHTRRASVTTYERTLMTRIIQGVFNFQQRVFGAKRDLFEQLHSGQRPLALFITCSDSRINPNLLTQTEPGELFVLRNAGNLVPPDGSPTSGERATIDYAVQHLHVRDIILCGHSQCGAMQGVVNPAAVAAMPAVADWLRFGASSVERAKQRRPSATGEAFLQAVIEQNVLMQVEHLQTFPAVQEAAAAGHLRLHAWVYLFETGEVIAYDPRQERFVPLSESPRQKLLVPMASAASSAPHGSM
jgi:carbonic anhydrase